MAYKIASPLHRAFVETLQRVRKSKGMTQKDAAEKMGISQPTYAQLEMGRASPTIDTIERAAKALGVDALYLLSSPKVAAVS